MKGERGGEKKKEGRGRRKKKWIGNKERRGERERGWEWN